MLVGVWEALDAAIPRLEAHEALSQYTVAVVASPNVGDESRESVLSGWRKLLSDGRAMLRGDRQDDHNGNGHGDEDGAYTRHVTSQDILEDGSILRRGKMDTPLRDVFAKIKGAFGGQVRD